jgi:hypothetical protein
MFEISIFCVILLAVSYWAVLWMMGRREDVLHGEFVEAGTAEEPVQSVVPDRPAIPERAAARAAAPTPPSPIAIPEQPAFRPERLESLLNSIKQDLNQLVRK